jgi:hypothetical protein
VRQSAGQSSTRRLSYRANRSSHETHTAMSNWCVLLSRIVSLNPHRQWFPSPGRFLSRHKGRSLRAPLLCWLYGPASLAWMLAGSRSSQIRRGLGIPTAQ